MNLLGAFPVGRAETRPHHDIRTIHRRTPGRPFLSSMTFFVHPGSMDAISTSAECFRGASNRASSTSAGRFERERRSDPARALPRGTPRTPARSRRGHAAGLSRFRRELASVDPRLVGARWPRRRAGESTAGRVRAPTPRWRGGPPRCRSPLQAVESPPLPGDLAPRSPDASRPGRRSRARARVPSRPEPGSACGCDRS